MGWREDMIARHKRDIKSMQEGIDWMETGKMQAGEVSGGGYITDLTAEAIERYKRTISELQAIIAKLEKHQ